MEDKVIISGLGTDTASLLKVHKQNIDLNKYVEVSDYLNSNRNFDAICKTLKNVSPRVEYLRAFIINSRRNVSARVTPSQALINAICLTVSSTQGMEREGTDVSIFNWQTLINSRLEAALGKSLEQIAASEGSFIQIESTIKILASKAKQKYEKDYQDSFAEHSIMLFDRDSVRFPIKLNFEDGHIHVAGVNFLINLATIYYCSIEYNTLDEAGRCTRLINRWMLQTVINCVEDRTLFAGCS